MTPTADCAVSRATSVVQTFYVLKLSSTGKRETTKRSGYAFHWENHCKSDSGLYLSDRGWCIICEENYGSLPECKTVSVRTMCKVSEVSITISQGQ